MFGPTVTKREGSKPNSTPTVRATLIDLVFSDLLHQDKTFDLLPCTSPPTLPVYILWLETYTSFTHTNTQSRIHNSQRLTLTFTKMLTSTNFLTTDYSSECRLQKSPESTSFLIAKCSSTIRLLLGFIPSHVSLHLLGQVAGATECSNNQPSFPTQSYSPQHTHKNPKCILSASRMFIQGPSTYSAKITSSAKIRRLSLSIYASLSSSATFSSFLY